MTAAECDRLELLAGLYREEWLKYKAEQCDAVLAQHGGGLFAVELRVAMDALNAGLDLYEWLAEFKPDCVSARRL